MSISLGWKPASSSSPKSNEVSRGTFSITIYLVRVSAIGCFVIQLQLHWVFSLYSVRLIVYIIIEVCLSHYSPRANSPTIRGEHRRPCLQKHSLFAASGSVLTAIRSRNTMPVLEKRTKKLSLNSPLGKSYGALPFKERSMDLEKGG